MDVAHLSIAELRAKLQEADDRDLKAMVESLSRDPRAGARQLAFTWRNRHESKLRETARLERLMKYELELAAAGYESIAGVDEVGRGALAGPLVAAAVILTSRTRIPGINDSKKLTVSRRETLAEVIKEQAIAWSVAEVSYSRIDQIGLQAANITALNEAVDGLTPPPDFVICDGFKLGHSRIKSMALIKGDSLSQTVAAASILAKVYRDDLMVSYHERFPAYGFEVNKGYATAEHMEAIERTGPCDVHRRSFRPVSGYGSAQLTLDASDVFLLEAKRSVEEDDGIEQI